MSSHTYYCLLLCVFSESSPGFSVSHFPAAEKFHFSLTPAFVTPRLFYCFKFLHTSTVRGRHDCRFIVVFPVLKKQ